MEVLGTSTLRKMEIALKPLLPSPTINSSEGIIKSGADGSTDISWNSIEGAQEYHITLSDLKGHSKTLKNKNNQILIENLMPGQYQVKVCGMDQFGRNGEFSLPSKIIVPEKNNLKAPSLKSKKVKSDND